MYNGGDASTNGQSVDQMALMQQMMFAQQMQLMQQQMPPPSFVPSTQPNQPSVVYVPVPIAVTAGGASIMHTLEAAASTTDSPMSRLPQFNVPPPPIMTLPTDAVPPPPPPPPLMANAHIPSLMNVVCDMPRPPPPPAQQCRPTQKRALTDVAFPRKLAKVRMTADDASRIRASVESNAGRQQPYKERLRHAMRHQPPAKRGRRSRNGVSPPSSPKQQTLHSLIAEEEKGGTAVSDMEISGDDEPPSDVAKPSTSHNGKARHHVTHTAEDRQDVSSEEGETEPACLPVGVDMSTVGVSDDSDEGEEEAKELPQCPPYDMPLDVDHYKLNPSSRSTVARSRQTDVVHKGLLGWMRHIDVCRRRHRPNAVPPPVAVYNQCKCGTVDVSDCESSDEGEEEEISSDDSEEEEGQLGIGDDDARSTVTQQDPVADRQRERAAFYAKKRATKEAQYARQNAKMEANHAELQRKRTNPQRLHADIWHNEPALLNDSLACRCSYNARKVGVRHDVYEGETELPTCDRLGNNAQQLHHYRMTIFPSTNMFGGRRTTIVHDGKEFLFEGYSIMTHKPINNLLSACHLTRWNTEYALHVDVVEEGVPPSFCVADSDLYVDYVFNRVLEMYDVGWGGGDEGERCSVVHVMPRFVSQANGSAPSLLPMCHVLSHLTRAVKKVVPDEHLDAASTDEKWLAHAESLKGMIVVNPKTRPCALRLDGVDVGDYDDGRSTARHSTFTHYSRQPTAMSYSGNTMYQRAYRLYCKTRMALTNRMHQSSMSAKGRGGGIGVAELRNKMEHLYDKLSNMRRTVAQEEDSTVHVPANGFYTTGLYPDVVHHSVMLLSLVSHIRYDASLTLLETEHLQYTFKSRSLLHLALAHTSYTPTTGPNADHARNTLNNCGLIDIVTGTAHCDGMNQRRRGIQEQWAVMATHGTQHATQSAARNNERLEFLGDAVLEFVTTVQLYRIMESADEGVLATYRSAIVQNKHLAIMARRTSLQSFMLYAHGPDLCHEADIRHAMANAFEAVCGALYIDGGLDVAQAFIARALFPPDAEPNRHAAWNMCRPHILQRQTGETDAHMVDHSRTLLALRRLQGTLGVRFKHIRLLAKAMTRRHVPYNLLTLGDNQRMEFLGDTVLQLITSDYLYKHFPDHHEGHLSLLRSSLVNNETQSKICTELGLTAYHEGNGEQALFAKHTPLRMKDKADLVESLLGALFVDQGLTVCKVLVRVCFISRLRHSITSQSWNDAKSRLQQSCLTLRDVNTNRASIPRYRTIAQTGPTNSRQYTVAVYYRGERMADATRPTVQEAEMAAADLALKEHSHRFAHITGEQHQPSRGRGGGGRGGYARRGMWPSRGRGGGMLTQRGRGFAGVRAVRKYREGQPSRAPPPMRQMMPK